MAFGIVALGLDVITASDDEAKPTTAGDGVKLRVTKLAGSRKRGECIVVGEGESHTTGNLAKRGIEDRLGVVPVTLVSLGGCLQLRLQALVGAQQLFKLLDVILC